MSGGALMFISIGTKKANSTPIRYHFLLNYSSIGAYLYDTIRQLVPFFVLLFASTTIDAQTIDDVTKVLFDNKEICGNPFGNPKWVPALDECIEGCDIRTQLCLESDELQQRCDQLPDQCIDLLKSRFGAQLSTLAIRPPQSKPVVAVVQQLNRPSTSAVIPPSTNVSLPPPSPPPPIANRFQSVTPPPSTSVADIAVQQNPGLVMIGQQTVIPQQPQTMAPQKKLPELQLPTTISPMIPQINSIDQPSSLQQPLYPNQPQITIQPNLNEPLMTPPPAAPAPIPQPPPANWSSQLYPPIPPVQVDQQNEFYQGQQETNHQPPPAPYQQQQQTPDSAYAQYNHPAPIQQPAALSFGDQQPAAPIQQPAALSFGDQQPAAPIQQPAALSFGDQQTAAPIQQPAALSFGDQQPAAPIQQPAALSFGDQQPAAPIQQPAALWFGDQQPAAPMIPDLPSEYQQAPSNAIQSQPPSPSLYLVVQANPVDYMGGGAAQPPYMDIDQQQQSALQPPQKYIYFEIETEPLTNAYLSSLNEPQEVHVDLPTIDDSIDAKPESYPSMNSNSYPSVVAVPSNSPPQSSDLFNYLSAPSGASDIIVISDPTDYATVVTDSRPTVSADYHSATEIVNNPILLSPPPPPLNSVLYANAPIIDDIIDAPAEPYATTISAAPSSNSMHLGWNEKVVAYGSPHRKLNRASGTS